MVSCGSGVRKIKNCNCFFFLPTRATPPPGGVGKKAGSSRALRPISKQSDSATQNRDSVLVLFLDAKEYTPVYLVKVSTANTLSKQEMIFMDVSFR